MSGKHMNGKAVMKAHKAWKAQADPREDHSLLIGLTPEQADRRVAQALKELGEAGVI